MVSLARPPVFRVIVIVLDSVGIGELPDASAYRDEGSNTLGNIAKDVALRLPTLRALGLDQLVNLGGGPASKPLGAFGRMAERSPGKDSVTGHWELMGLVIDRAFPVFPEGFPAEWIREFEDRIGRPILGNVVASGTEIIDRLGDEHVRTGRPIVYTSADSVFQIAAHEDVVPVPELYRYCEVAFDIVCRRHGVGRVIARPFIGPTGAFTRTSNRHDYALEPRGETLLDRLQASGRPVVSIGKIKDLFAGRGITRATSTTSDDHGMDVLEAELARTANGLIFTNLVDFDTLYGHRNDVGGYAANLERFDARLARLLPKLMASDLLFVTADHGNDPTTPSTDHSREHVPIFAVGPAVSSGINLGRRDTFADLGQTLADIFALPALPAGTSFAADLWPRA